MINDVGLYEAGLRDGQRVGKRFVRAENPGVYLERCYGAIGKDDQQRIMYYQGFTGGCIRAWSDYREAQRTAQVHAQRVRAGNIRSKNGNMRPRPGV